MLFTSKIFRRFLVFLKYAIAEVNKQSFVSIGLSMYPLNADDPDSLIKKADIAMYVSKEKGRNTYHFYKPEMDTLLFWYISNFPVNISLIQSARLKRPGNLFN